VVAYLQDQGGIEVTVEIPAATGEQQDEEVEAELEEEEEPEPREAISDPAELVAMFTCDACHMINGEGGEAGPDLSKIGASRDRNYLRLAIVNPNADIAEGFEPDMMPEDLAEQIYVSELEVLVDFLAEMK
ncbi:MAG: c-type cytochrome, partial [Hyphomicrobiales bacterium]|nr:c-type cytochrome [Hyphomicrobiales bacterium]